MNNSNIKDDRIKPFLRWAGSKRQLLPILSEFWNDSYHCYIEPFAGSAALFFYLSPQKAILADINSELIMTYYQIKTNLPHVLEALSLLKKSKSRYYYLRSLEPNSLSAPFRAARFIYLNRFCFNGLYRTNRRGKFNVPYGGDRTGNIPSAESLRQCSKKLSKVRILKSSFEITLKYAKEGDFVYIDPPFKVSSRRVFNEYDAVSFDSSSLIKLREWLIAINKKNISFLVSYADSDEARYLSGGFYSIKVSARRNISGFIGSRKIDNELLIYNKHTEI